MKKTFDLFIPFVSLAHHECESQFKSKFCPTLYSFLNLFLSVVEDCAHIGPEYIGGVTFDNDDETVSVGSSNSSFGDVEITDCDNRIQQVAAV